MTNTNAADIIRQIRNIEIAAFGMGHEPNAGQAQRIAALKAQLAEMEG